MTTLKCDYQLTDWHKHKSELQFAIDTLEKNNGIYEVREEVKEIKNYKTERTDSKLLIAVFVPRLEGLK